MLINTWLKDESSGKWNKKSALGRYINTPIGGDKAAVPSWTPRNYTIYVTLCCCQVKTTLGDWLDGISDLSSSLQQMDIDASAYACLSALTLVNGESEILVQYKEEFDIFAFF